MNDFLAGNQSPLWQHMRRYNMLPTILRTNGQIARSVDAVTAVSATATVSANPSAVKAFIMPATPIDYGAQPVDGEQVIDTAVAYPKTAQPALDRSVPVVQRKAADFPKAHMQATAGDPQSESLLSMTNVRREVVSHDRTGTDSNWRRLQTIMRQHEGDQAEKVAAASTQPVAADPAQTKSIDSQPDLLKPDQREKRPLAVNPVATQNTETAVAPVDRMQTKSLTPAAEEQIARFSLPLPDIPSEVVNPFAGEKSQLQQILDLPAAAENSLNMDESIPAAQQGLHNTIDQAQPLLSDAGAAAIHAPQAYVRDQAQMAAAAWQQSDPSAAVAQGTQAVANSVQTGAENVGQELGEKGNALLQMGQTEGQRPLDYLTSAVETGQSKLDAVQAALPTKDVPLNAIWPVKTVQAPQIMEGTEAVKPQLPPNPLPQALTAVDEFVSTQLAKVPPGQPTSSIVPLMRPRRPRPVLPELETAVPTPQIPTADDAAQLIDQNVTGLMEDVLPTTPMPALGLPAAPNLDDQLPADLWNLLGKQPPALPQLQDLANAGAAALQSSIPDGLTEAIDGIMPANNPLSEQLAALPNMLGATAVAPPEINIDRLAHQVYNKIRQQLIIEWERIRRL